MESREGMNTGVTVIAPEAPSSYHVAPRTENSTPIAVTPPALPSPASAVLFGTSDKKKRGRPRKYSADGPNSRPLSPMPISSSAPAVAGNFLADKTSAGGRPYTSEKKHKPKVENLGEWVACSTGGSFLPHMITVNAGEDVSKKIVSFCQNGPRAICVISAVGLISNVTLRQPNSSGGTLTYEGRFEILSLSGSFTPTELGGSRVARTGGMSISLASPDGRVVGGTLAGLLVAASPVQVVVGSFLPSNHNELKPKKHKYEHKSLAAAGSAAAAPRTNNMLVEHRISTVQGLNNVISDNQGMVASSTLQTANWANISSMEDSRKSNTDINISLQGQ
nr:AT-hook motif nuclear-localized protein 1-like [Coffea arabica]XP_027107822.1 AT-hook motif nuclear-localized protein 1-like [Coffea arabica]XP_027107823.1 AT-hook motif nuclear-localized protein 1-like [Coffea arabica]XP_027107824.1 AT-hook motif nuclear-localized protein 1-like [Coffea arabica]